MVDTFSEADNRKQTWERDIKGFAKKRYVVKNFLMTQSSSAWNNSFYQKTATSLTGGQSSTVKGIPPGADFPFMERGTTLKNAVILQHGGEGVIYWQDILTSNIAIEAETISDVTDAVVYSVDNICYSTLSENDTPTTINTVAITAGYEWDSDTTQNRDPTVDIAKCIEQITTDRYPIVSSGLGFIAMNEATFTYFITNSKVLNSPLLHLAEGNEDNGFVGSFMRLGVYVSPTITNDKVLVGMKKKCGTWKQVQALTVDVIIDPQKKYTIRASEIGTVQLTDPESLCLLTNVRK
jgi:hypothetical protein